MRKINRPDAVNRTPSASNPLPILDFGFWIADVGFKLIQNTKPPASCIRHLASSIYYPRITIRFENSVFQSKIRDLIRQRNGGQESKIAKPYPLCSLPFAPCPIPFALCTTPSAVCSLPYAHFALCPLPFAHHFCFTS